MFTSFNNVLKYQWNKFRIHINVSRKCYEGLENKQFSFILLHFVFQENHLAKRHDLQKMAAFNLGVAEAVQTKKKTRDRDFHVSILCCENLCVEVTEIGLAIFLCAFINLKEYF